MKPWHGRMKVSSWLKDLKINTILEKYLPNSALLRRVCLFIELKKLRNYLKLY